MKSNRRKNEYQDKLYSLATPNGQKASISLEEMGFDYDAHKIDIMKNDQFTDEYIKINPNSKIPAIVDPVGNNGKPLAIMESGSILVYLAEKSGKFLPTDTAKRSQAMQWLFFQVGGVGPMFGQFGHFHVYAKEKCKDPYPEERYAKETMRLLAVMDKQLANNKYLAGEEITIADFATAPWVMALSKFYKATERLQLNKYENVNSWVKGLSSRPAFQKGLGVCGFD